MKKILENNWFKILGVIILILALGTHPYSYYQFLRWVITILGVYSAYLTYEQKDMTWVWIFGIIAVLFNPIAPFYLQKETWQTIDVITAIVITVNIYKSYKKALK